MAPIIWQSKKLKRITKSPLATETMAVGEAADAGILVANMCWAHVKHVRVVSLVLVWSKMTVNHPHIPYTEQTHDT